MRRGAGHASTLLPSDAICTGQKVQHVNMARALVASVQRSLKGVLQEIVDLDPSMSAQSTRHSVKPKPGGRRQHVYRLLDLRPCQ
jgi:hypothetical protein